MESSLLDLFHNVSFWAALCAWLTAQFAKMLNGFRGTGRLDFHYLVSTGGMPSAHSAMATGLALSVGLEAGFGSPVFAVALAFSIVVMFDASTVRRAAGQQARLLNEIIDELFKKHRLSEQKLAHLLGHTRLEVFMGMVIGVLVALLVHAVPVLLGTPDA